MAALAPAIVVSALSALAASWALGLRDADLLSNALVVWLIVLPIGMLFVGLWRVLHVVRPYRSGAESARLLEGLFQVGALLLALAGGNAVGAWLQGEVAMRTLATPLESLAVPVDVLGALTTGLALFLVLRRVPRQLLALRLKGVLSDTGAGEILALTTGFGMLWITLGLYSALAATLSKFTPFFVIGTAAILGYAASRLWLARPNPNTDPRLWLVLPHPKTVPGWPQLADRIARGHRAGPMTLVSPPDAVPLGEHLYLSDRLGMLDSLFPRLEIEVRDWQRTLPPADRWSGVVHRQVHPPIALMPMLLDSYLGPLDQVLLIASCEDDVQIWRGRLPVDRTRVLWVSPQGKGQAGARPDRVAGYPIIVMDAKTRGRIKMQGWFSSQDKQVTPDEVREAPFEDRDKYWKQEVARLIAVLRQLPGKPLSEAGESAEEQLTDAERVGAKRPQPKR